MSRLFRRTWIRLPLWFVCALLLSGGCRNSSPNQNATPAPLAAADPNKPVPDPLPEVLARIDGHAIRRAEFEVHIAKMEMNVGRKVPDEKRNEIYRKALDQLIDIKLLKTEVESRDIQADEKGVDEQMQKIRARFPSEEEFAKALAARGVSPARLRSDMLDESRISKMMEVETAGAAAITDAEVRDFYQKNPDKFKQPEAVRASHVLVRAKQDDAAASKKALAVIQNVHREAKAGKDFAELARKYSADGSAQRGGDLGFFTKDRMVPEFADAAFALKPGQISGIVRTSHGYHVIKVVERRPVAEIPLEQVSGQVREYLTQQRKQEKEDAFVQLLRNKAKIEILI